MTTLRAFKLTDLLSFNNVNLDPLTETYNTGFYLQYFLRWPEYFYTAESTTGRIMGYIIGKAEGKGESWHGHVTAVTVAPEYRRISVAAVILKLLEDVSEFLHNAYFVDLFVRLSNYVAINMYERMDYVKYRRVLAYYSGEEDAWDMRKALPRDINKKSIIPLTKPVRPEDLEW
eukprot:TRINITY_DN4746_c0_g1_i1.p1 TRINITY_DN4746_c0_g1~~TRINITY_DN4746_c0_g1_i1.p1  ORF type:complete len:192 (-),score=57.87 TRINITY_DN4746_c0_g1_i1:34-555(-)